MEGKDWRASLRMQSILGGKSSGVVDLAQAQASARRYADEAGRRCLPADKEIP
jgi:hypothetical protein